MVPAPPAPRAAPASGPERSVGRSGKVEEARQETGQAQSSWAEGTGQGWEGTRAALCVPVPLAVGMHLALKVDLLAQVDELLCPLHGLHTGIAFLHQLGRP